MEMLPPVLACHFARSIRTVSVTSKDPYSTEWPALKVIKSKASTRYIGKRRLLVSWRMANGQIGQR